MVHQAFDVLDSDSSGTIDMADIKKLYNAKGHRDVIDGRRTEDEILRELLDSFDAAGKTKGAHDGVVTLEEFEEYYSNISASVDDDDYFELMIRNAWHITGGTGWCENTSNRRVLVTLSDGTQSVVEIKKDLGLKAGDKVGMVARLRSQGVNAATVSFNGATDGKTGRGGDGSNAPITPASTLGGAAVVTAAAATAKAASNNKSSTSSSSSSSSSIGGPQLQQQIRGGGGGAAPKAPTSLSSNLLAATVVDTPASLPPPSKSLSVSGASQNTKYSPPAPGGAMSLASVLQNQNVPNSGSINTLCVRSLSLSLFLHFIRIILF